MSSLCVPRKNTQGSLRGFIDGTFHLSRIMACFVLGRPPSLPASCSRRETGPRFLSEPEGVPSKSASEHPGKFHRQAIKFLGSKIAPMGDSLNHAKWTEMSTLLILCMGASLAGSTRNWVRVRDWSRWNAATYWSRCSEWATGETPVLRRTGVPPVSLSRSQRFLKSMPR